MITGTTTQWSVIGTSAAAVLQAVQLFENADGEWIATTSPGDAAGNPTGVFALDVHGDLVIDTVAPSGLRAALTPAALLAYP